jgi:C1A family cysteine protease
MPVPGPSEGVDGGHAVVACGYEMMRAPWDRAKKDYAICRNSWDGSWGDGGYFYMPLSWMCSNWNADDLWIITINEG